MKKVKVITYAACGNEVVRPYATVTPYPGIDNVYTREISDPHDLERAGLIFEFSGHYIEESQYQKSQLFSEGAAEKIRQAHAGYIEGIPARNYPQLIHIALYEALNLDPAPLHAKRNEVKAQRLKDEIQRNVAADKRAQQEKESKAAEQERERDRARIAPAGKIGAAQVKKINTTLDSTVNYSGYGIMTRRSFISMLHNIKGSVKMYQNRNYKKEEKEREDLDYLRRHMPYGNQNHPQCKEYAERKAELEKGIFTPEYRAILPDESFYTITKTEFDYFNSL